ncbi:hypothetical protein RRG08_006678 [Elysia crispata]|uniref:Protein quiver n=1 Tax=Elysia crispata TaxID=231223 RepID=A0AAE0YVX5_9GAST|nr:hypothetical protein RRG08_006678 [Elysia crispata]
MTFNFFPQGYEEEMTERFSALKKGRSIFLFSTVTSLVAALLLFPSPSASLECYSCNSYENASCEAGDLMPYKMQCGPMHKGCRKWQFFFDALGNGKIMERVARECADVKMDKCYRGFGASGKRFKRVICECMSDNCNTAATIKVNLMMAVSALLPLVMQL